MPTTPGRPREFDREAALETALLEFWRHGYDGTSIAMLTDAIGIGRPSLYAAFGDKRALFHQAVERYVKTHGSYGTDALAEPTARAAVEKLLMLAAIAYTEPDYPPGCLIISGASPGSPDSEDVAAALRAQRERTTRAIAEKIEADIAADLLPPGTDADALAAFYSATVQGMSTQARDGATRAQLETIASIAMQAWPT